MQDEEAANNVCNTWAHTNAALVIWGATLVTERCTIYSLVMKFQFLKIWKKKDALEMENSYSLGAIVK